MPNYFEPILKCRSYGLTFKCYLDLQPTRTNISNDTSTHEGEQLCPSILKSMYKCISKGPDKLNL